MKVPQKAIAYKIQRENFCILSKILINRETFLAHNFYRLRYYEDAIINIASYSNYVCNQYSVYYIHIISEILVGPGSWW